MKRAIAIILCIAMILSGCSHNSSTNTQVTESTTVQEESSATETETDAAENEAMNETSGDIMNDSSVEPVESMGPESMELKEVVPNYSGMDDPELLNYVEYNVYTNLVQDLNSEGYFVENVEAVYFSQEYIDELTYNSRSNIFFGYTLQELDQQFQGDRYIFTIDDNGETTVKKMETVYDDSTERVIKNVAVGGGVILICVTVSVVSAGVGAPAVSMIFAAAAQTGTSFAVSSAVIGGAAATITTGYQTHDPEAAFKAGLLAGSEGFKWGAISGAIVGGVSEGTALYGAAKQTNFTMNQYAKIQQETGYPLDVIKQFHNMNEYEVFKEANLKSTMVGNKSALIKTDIDLYRLDSKGRTNLERMKQGLAPQDSNGLSYELHHVGQKKDGTLAILTQAEHDNPAIHGFLERTEAHAAGTNWDAERQAFWKAFAAMVG